MSKATDADLILSYLASRGRSNSQSISDGTGIKLPRVRAALRMLIDTNKIDFHDHGRDGKSYSFISDALRAEREQDARDEESAERLANWLNNNTEAYVPIPDRYGRIKISVRLLRRILLDPQLRNKVIELIDGNILIGLAKMGDDE